MNVVALGSLVVGVPDNRPVLSRVSPDGRVPVLGTLNVSPDISRSSVSSWTLAAVPAVRLIVEVVMVTGLYVIVTVALSVTPDPSVTITDTLYTSVESPDSDPVIAPLLESARPLGNGSAALDGTLQV
jgi:hypothetical protein